MIRHIEDDSVTLQWVQEHAHCVIDAIETAIALGMSGLTHAISVADNGRGHKMVVTPRSGLLLGDEKFGLDVTGYFDSYESERRAGAWVVVVVGLPPDPADVCCFCIEYAKQKEHSNSAVMN